MSSKVQAKTAAAAKPSLPKQDIKLAVGKKIQAHGPAKQDVTKAREAVEHIGAVLAKGTGPNAKVEYTNGAPAKLADIASRYSDIKKGKEAQAFYDELDTWFRKG